MADQFVELEAREGLRFTWNCFPNTKVEAARTVVPVACMVTPLKEIPDMQLLQYEPVRCKGCNAVLNPYARVDFQGKVWACPICQGRNHLPPAYHQISEQYLPPELIQSSNVVEYALPSTVQHRPPVYMLVLDVAQDERALGYMKEAMLQVRRPRRISSFENWSFF